MQIGVNHFQRAGCADEIVCVRAKGLSGRQEKRWAKALAAREDAPADRFVYLCGFVGFFWEQAIEFGVDQRVKGRKECKRSG